MKKTNFKALMISCAILSFLFVLGFAFPVVAATVPEAEISPLGTCSNHIFEFSGYHAGNNEHTFVCANEGCTARIIEECYFHGFCGSYSDTDSVLCDRCHRGTIYIHDYVPNHDWSSETKTHNFKCQNFDEFLGGCEAYHHTNDEITEEACTLGPTLIWRGFEPNRGHILTQNCSVCNYTYDSGNFYPEYHPNYFSETNDCYYCQLKDPYYAIYQN